MTLTLETEYPLFKFDEYQNYLHLTCPTTNLNTNNPTKIQIDIVSPQSDSTMIDSTNHIDISTIIAQFNTMVTLTQGQYKPSVPDTRALIQLHKDNFYNESFFNGYCNSIIPESLFANSIDGSILIVVEDVSVVTRTTISSFSMGLRLDLNGSEFVNTFAVGATSLNGGGSNGNSKRDVAAGPSCDLHWDVGNCDWNAGWNTSINYDTKTSKASKQLSILNEPFFSASCDSCYSILSFDFTANVKYSFKHFKLDDSSFIQFRALSELNVDFEAGIQNNTFVTETVTLAEYVPPGGFNSKYGSVGPAIKLDSYADITSTLKQIYTTGIEAGITPFQITYYPTTKKFTMEPNTPSIKLNPHKLQKTPDSTASNVPIILDLGIHLIPKLEMDINVHYAHIEFGIYNEIGFDFRTGLVVELAKGLPFFKNELLNGFNNVDSGCNVPYALNYNGTLSATVNVSKPVNFVWYDDLFSLDTKNITTGCINFRTGGVDVPATGGSASGGSGSGGNANSTGGNGKSAAVGIRKFGSGVLWVGLIQSL
ncbi:hypothetical protein HDU76_003891 [Blyttiomyces sp. JEL0837]|nr:hypothetical protein HDU76_003891 [Blyttiomyces sp. JEL0837]